MQVTKSLFYFVLAGFCEIGGGYLIWLWLREGKSVGLAVLGGFVLILYGLVPTLQPAHFGRVYAPMVESSSFFQCCGVGKLIGLRRTDSTCSGV